MSKKEVDELLRELERKFNDPTSEERKEMEEAERVCNDNLMRALRGGNEEEVTAQPFECRVCGCTKYKTIRKSNGILGPGGFSRITGYECEGCSVTFSDVAEFSNK